LAGTLQKHLLKQEQRSDDDVLVALAGIKQVVIIICSIIDCYSICDLWFNVIWKQIRTRVKERLKPKHKPQAWNIPHGTSSTVN